MGLFDKIEERQQKKFNQRLFTFFNSQTASWELPSPINAKYQEAEYKLWYQASTSEELLKFYNTRVRADLMYQTNNFYRTSQNADLAFMHYNLAQSISRSMADLIFSKKPTFKAASGNQKKDKLYDTALETILKENRSAELFHDAAEKASYSGMVGFKLTLDTDLSEHPIIEAYPKENLEVIKSHGRITDIIFKDYYVKDGGTTYVLYSIYGRGYIKYRLYSENFTITNQDAKREEVPLTLIPELSDLSDIEVRYSDGTPCNKILAVVINNKGDGKSDYFGCIDDFIAIDEAYTQFETYLRRSSIKMYLPEFHAEKNAKTGEIVRHNLDYGTSITYVPTSNPNWQATEIKRDVVKDMDKALRAYIDTMNSLILRATQTAGLSTSTLGYDIAGANASGTALNIRERLSITTRNEKQAKWQQGLEELSEILVSLDSYKSSGNILYIDNIKPNFYVEFPEYIQDLKADQNALNITVDKLENGLITKADAIKEVNPGMDPKDILTKLEELSEEDKTKIERPEQV